MELVSCFSGSGWLKMDWQDFAIWFFGVVGGGETSELFVAEPAMMVLVVLVVLVQEDS